MLAAPAAAPPKLPPPGVVDVWCVALDVPSSRLRELTSGLDEDERRHWARMRVGGYHWAAARGARRAVLAQYLGVSPASLRFETDVHGKPRLIGTALRFNVSVRDRVAVIAVAADREVGVDVECEHTVRDSTDVAEQFLSSADLAFIAAAPVTSRRRRFTEAWTRHEAVRKAYGVALEAVLPVSGPDRAVVAKAVAAPLDHVISVAARGSDWSVRLRELPEAR